MTECDRQLRKHLESLGSKVDRNTQPLGPRPKGRKPSKNAPAFDLRSEWYRLTGIGWAPVDGLDVLTAQTVIAEAGLDRNAFPGEKQFVSWLGLCPTKERSGGKTLNRRTRKVIHRAAGAFRNAARTLLRSQSYWGAQYRRLRTRLGAPKAITAMARKLVSCPALYLTMQFPSMWGRPSAGGADDLVVCERPPGRLRVWSPDRSLQTASSNFKWDRTLAAAAFGSRPSSGRCRGGSRFG
jgi:hypothetical protein